MNDYELNTNDYELIKKLLNISSIIANLYDKLCELETKEENNSEEYTKLLEYLDAVLDTEKNNIPK